MRCEALLQTSFPRRCGSAGPPSFRLPNARRVPGRRSAVASSPPVGCPRRTAYTRAMRRWVCIVALLAGFAADPGLRPRPRRPPVAVERLLEEVFADDHLPADVLRGTAAWWLRL